MFIILNTREAEIWKNISTTHSQAYLAYLVNFMLGRNLEFKTRWVAIMNMIGIKNSQ